MEGNTAAAAEPRSVLPQASLSLVLCLALAGASLLSLWVGAQDISISTIMQSFTSYNAANVQEMIVQTLRFPRLLAALTCGASFAVAGAIMQGVTNNPMASPSILGINAGAGFGLAVAMILFPQGSLGLSLVFSFMGAAIATLAIFLLAQAKGSGRGAVFLALAGTAIGLGVPLNRARFLYLMAAVALAASCVAIGGSIGFVGLLCPHIARRLVGVQHTRSIPLTVLIGALLVVSADWVGRVIIAPDEMLLGIVIALIGAPYFLFVLARAKA